VVVATAHGLVEDLDGEHAMTIVLEADEVIDLHGVCAGEPPPALVEVHLPYMAEQHLHGPQPSHAGGHPQDNLLGLLPIDNGGDRGDGDSGG
jgi:hypothetical protein